MPGVTDSAATIAKVHPAGLASAIDPSLTPYRSGPVSRFMAGLDALPGHGWWVPLGLALLLIGWAHAVQWASGRLRVGELDSFAAILAVYGPYALATGALGQRTARRALSTFWPATGWPDSEQAAWAYEFANIPARHESAALLVGLIGGFGALVGAPASVLGPEEGRLALFVAYAPTFALGYSLLAVGVVLTVRWLRLVARIHREATAIDPFDRAPVYAFSRLTVLTGLAYALGVYFSFTVNAAFQVGNVLALAFLGVSIVFAVAAFVAPLWGIHVRLVREKAVLLRDIERRMSQLTTEAYARMDARAYDSVSPIGSSLSGLNAMRERIVHLPTWPWPPQLLGGFISALLLPVIVYLLTRLVSTLLGTS
jgi:hypothetical protein